MPEGRNREQQGETERYDELHADGSILPGIKTPAGESAETVEVAGATLRTATGLPRIPIAFAARNHNDPRADIAKACMFDNSECVAGERASLAYTP